MPVGGDSVATESEVGSEAGTVRIISAEVSICPRGMSKESSMVVEARSSARNSRSTDDRGGSRVADTGEIGAGGDDGVSGAVAGSVGRGTSTAAV